ncbi:MAG: SDR family NAD(P)-dependent oxidoreductase, partial [Candidatus Rokuibacteriota bacterium]
MKLEFHHALEALPLLLHGALVTLETSLLAVVLGVVVGTVLTVLRQSSLRPVEWACQAYMSVMRGTPLFIQILMVYYVLPAVGLDIPRFVAGVLALSLNSGAYVTEILRAGLSAIPRGQVDAARAVGMPRSPHPLAAGVTAAAQVEAMVATAMTKLGRVDILVNNAGGSGTVGVADIEETSEELWDRVVDTNLKGTFLCSRAVAPGMKAQRYGRIVNLSSVAARGSFGPLLTVGARLPYAAAKAGVQGLTYQLARDLGPWSITVNVVVPGFTLTEPGARVH